MLYRVIGIMSGSSLDGLDIAFAVFEESGGKWSYEIQAAHCEPYSPEWQTSLQNAAQLSAYEYLLLHTAYGRYIGDRVNDFIDKFNLHHQVQLVASHGHTVFHAPQAGMTAQIGDGAAIAATTQINVVSDLRSMDVAFGGQGAPIVPVGEKLLFPQYDLFLNIGGIANLSYKGANGYIAFDVCPANRVLNMLAQNVNLPYDEHGAIAASGKIYTPLLTSLNALGYYAKSYPKSLDNTFGTGGVYSMVQACSIPAEDKLGTYTEHIAMQATYAVQGIVVKDGIKARSILTTGGGAFNRFLVERLQQMLAPMQVELAVADDTLINFKEALIMALAGILRWREEYNVLHTVTGATRSSIGGAVWIGQEG